jgi:hypothetical protein
MEQKNSYLIQNLHNNYKSIVVEENNWIPPLPRKYGETPTSTRTFNAMYIKKSIVTTVYT